MAALNGVQTALNGSVDLVDQVGRGGVRPEFLDHIHRLPTGFVALNGFSGLEKGLDRTANRDHRYVDLSVGDLLGLPHLNCREDSVKWRRNSVKTASKTAQKQR